MCLDLLVGVDVEFEIGALVLLVGADFCKIGLQLLTCSAKTYTGNNPEHFWHCFNSVNTYHFHYSLATSISTVGIFKINLGR